MQNFSNVLEALKAGLVARRTGWNGKGMFIFLVPGSRFNVNREPLLSILGEGTPVSYHGHIDMKMADGSIMVWSPAQVDLLGDDWEILPRDYLDDTPATA